MSFASSWVENLMVRFTSPLFYYELLRQTRKGRGHALRVAYALFVLAGIAWQYGQRFGLGALLDFSFSPPADLTPNDLTAFSGDLARVFLVMQAVAVTILTPACLAGSIVEEKERHTLQLLFTTHLTEWEILTGKLYARLAPLGEMLLAGIPLLGLLQLLGGVPFQLTAAMFAATVATLVTYGCMSLLASAMSRTVVAAIGMSFGMMIALIYATASLAVFGLVYLASPVALLFALEQAHLKSGHFDIHCIFLLLTFLAVQLLLALLFFLGAWRQLRWERGSARYLGGDRMIRQEEEWRPRHADEATTAPRVQRVPDEPTARESEPNKPPLVEVPLVTLVREPPWTRHRRRRERLGRPSMLPPMEGDPLIWKEWVSGRMMPETQTVFTVLYAVAGGLLLMIVLLCSGIGHRFSGDWYRSFAAGTLSLLGLPLTLMLCVMTAYHAAGCILKERMQKTWDNLLMLPQERRHVLWAKLAGCLLTVKSLGWQALLVWVVAGLVMAIPWYAVPFLILHIVAVALFLATLGLWLSLRCRTLLQAQVHMGVWLALQFVALWPFGLSPMKTWWCLIFTVGEFERGDYFMEMVGVAVTLVVWLGGAAGFWMASVHRMQGDVEG